ncbi:MAG: Crp/Fnr family transcriptional regulator [Myxococcales bacterium]|nr:Crp/Fnr family transcriptional regulator [Myxococcales bacterium]HRC56132.1 Crp/Fnr family transcriptional regulator [Kofleriaceae bacterium]
MTPTVDSDLEQFAQEVPAGTVLFREGERGNVMYVVHRGEIELRRQVGATAGYPGSSERVLAVVTPGQFFGEMALLKDRPRSATAVVRHDARLLVIGATTLEAMLRARPEIALRIITTLTDRIENANQQIELLLLPSPNHRVVQCLRQFANEELAGQVAPGIAILVRKSARDLADRTGLSVAEVQEVLARLAAAQLVVPAEDTSRSGYLIPEVGQLSEFLEFLQLRDRYRQL